MGSIIYGDAIHIREQSKIDAARITQKASNEKNAKFSDLQRFSASLQNSSALDSAGTAIGDITGNIARNLDAAAYGRLQERVQAAEELGANSAMAAAAGVGGSSVEQYNSALRLNRDMANEQNERAVNSDLYLASQSKGNTLRAAVASFDNNVYAADLDFTQYVDHKKMGGFSKLLAIGATAAATYFGGPQAGSAVMGLFEGDQAAKNGDFATASRNLNTAMQVGVQTAGAKFKTGDTKWDSTQATEKAGSTSPQTYTYRGLSQMPSIRLK